VEVQGSYLVSLLANQYGNNSVLTPTHETDFQVTMTGVANSRNDGLEGLYPIIGTGGPFDSAPWTFWDPATNVNSAAGFQTNPDMTREKAERYMDSIVAYVAPRLYSALEISVGTEDLLDPNEVNMVMFPNPVADEIFVTANKDYLIRSIDVFDVKGTLLSHKEGINHHFTYYRVNDLAPGQYVMKVSFDQGVTARQFVVK
jgi:hypothetical protein